MLGQPGRRVGEQPIGHTLPVETIHQSGSARQGAIEVHQHPIRVQQEAIVMLDQAVEGNAGKGLHTH